MRSLEIVGIEGLGEIKPGDSIGGIVVEGCARLGLSLVDDDILVIAHKIVSKAEDRTISLAEVKPSARALELSRQLGKDASILEIILGESRRIIRMGGGTIIVETHQGFICANAGVDLSNVGLGRVALLPQDPDRSAAEIRGQIRQLIGVAPGVIISDSFGRPWRLGTVDVAVGVSGLKPLKDDRGEKDPYGYELRASVAAVADEFASAAELMMGKRDAVPVVVVRGYKAGGEEGTAKELLRPEAEDLFRNF
ncbi:MAG TPA: coenzyme F420-0:L-glutamate ligase [Candidatus Binatia bacterium]|jgi:coenzyme F420-0:L-glutamate ligase/coenzyme F420-1:gamma-L-glutamate ligase|nr:coenzyme F420-0:L-glutamate ligase [Candidatus Binatia bacterium]